MGAILTLDELRRTRPRDPFLWWSAVGFVALLIGAWGVVDLGWPEPARAGRNLARFVQESRPGLTLSWWRQVIRFDVVANTVAIGIVGTGLAVVGGAGSVLGASRVIAAPHPWATDPPGPPLARVAWMALRAVVRVALLFLRAIPEYVWAFLLVTQLGLSAWPAVLALALHNAGIIGKLYTETVDDLEPAAPRALRALGGSRLAVTLTGVVPQVQRRWLLYAFVRWESCIREATVVGLVGVVSLGWAIREARARTHYDEMTALVVVSAVLIVVADAISVGVRAGDRARWSR